MKAKLAFLFFACLFLVKGTFGEAQKASVIVTSFDNYTVFEGWRNDASAWGFFEDTVEQIGWAKLNIRTFDVSSPQLQAFAAGILESYFTHNMIYDYWENYKAAEYGSEGPPQALSDWMGKQLGWVNQSKTKGGQFFDQLNLIYSQFLGLNAGYQQFGDPGKPMTMLDLYMENSVGDLEDLNGLFKARGSDASHRPAPDEYRLTDCSGMVKIIDNGKDVACGQTTWRAYYAMLRVYKMYDFGFNTNRFVSMSSSPGLMHSKDDFYALSNGLIVMETTNSIANKSLYDLLHPETALSWQRVMIANALATGGEKWTELFKQYNSGTYNNQWMVIDSKLFVPGSDLPPNFFWICEQIPGLVHAGDVTGVLQKQGYWPSYNIPYFVDIYNMSGYPELVKKYGPDYSYSDCVRAKMFKRNSTNINTFEDVKNMMIYNDYEIDPLSDKDPAKAIASRYDLDSSRHVAFGAIDSKVTSIQSLMTDFSVEAISGPTHAQQQPFSFAKFPDVQHIGVPEAFDFPWVSMKP